MSEGSSSSKPPKSSGTGAHGRSKGSIWQWLRGVVGRRNGDPSLREAIEEIIEEIGEQDPQEETDGTIGDHERVSLDIFA